jgi:radical SAM-linked protein
VEIRFEKSEAVRFISHHDLMRAFQRALRRASWPVRLTEGFNPRPRVVFPDALEVGVVSQDEAAEVELAQWIPLSKLERQLRRSLPPGLLLRSLKEVDPIRTGKRLIECRFRIQLREPQIRLSSRRLEELREAPKLPYRRRKRQAAGPTKELDLRPSLVDAKLDDNGDLCLNVKPSPNGTGRPLEYLSMLTGVPEDRLRGIRITRLRMTLGSPPPPQVDP